MNQIKYFLVSLTLLCVSITYARPTQAPVLADPGTRVPSGQTFILVITPVSGANWYDIEKSRDRSFTNPERSGTNATRMPFTIRGNTEEVTLYFRTRARNDDGSGPWSNIVDMTVDRGAPLPSAVAPVSPTLSSNMVNALSDQTYTLNWTAPDSTRSYFLVESQDSNFPPTSGVGISTSGNSQTFHHEATQPTTYYYRVYASNQVGHSNWSQTVSVHVSAERSPNVPPAPTVSDPGNRIPSGQTFTLIINPVSGANWYDIEKSRDRSFTNPERSGTNATRMPFTIRGNTEEVALYFRVKARNNNGSGLWSNTVDMVVERGVASTPTVPPPNPPTLSISRASALSDQTYTLSWTTPATATYYFLVESPNANFPSDRGTGVNTSGTSQSFHHEVAQSGTYYYRVRASNTAGSTAWSNVITITISPR